MAWLRLLVARPALIMVLSLLVLVSCGRASPPPIVVTRDDGALSTGCTPDSAAQLLERFFDAINQGDQEMLTHLLAHVRSVEIALGPPAAERNPTMLTQQSDILGFLATEHKHQAHLRLLSMILGSNDSDQTGFNYLALLTASDIAPGPDGSRVVSGKGGLDCANGQILAWWLVLAKPDAHPLPNEICPAPPSGTPSTAIVACTG